MYSNLKAEMKRHGIRITDVAQLIGKTEVAVGKNLNGTGGDFNVQEALIIQQVLFPKLSIEYLFRRG